MSVHRLPTGMWRVRWREHGKQHSRNFERKSDADAFDREIRRRQQLGPLAVERLTGKGGPTLGEWIEERWMPEHGSTLERSTVGRYASVYKIHIQPTLHSAPIGEITVSRLRAWQAERVRAGIDPETIKKARTFLSSVLRHAAESEAIPANPMPTVRAPKPKHKDGIRPLAPTTVEAIRMLMVSPLPRIVDRSGTGQRTRREYQLAAPGTAETNRRDALIVSLMAYAGLRPGEIRGLRFDDIGETTIRVERAADEYGALKRTKTSETRSVRLLTPLAQDLREYRMSEGRPRSGRMLLLGPTGSAWTKSDWNKWAADRWKPACRAAGMTPLPRPYDLRHSFASLLLAEGQQPLYVAQQLGHSVAVLLSTYAHLIARVQRR